MTSSNMASEFFKLLAFHIPYLFVCYFLTPLKLTLGGLSVPITWDTHWIRYMGVVWVSFLFLHLLCIDKIIKKYKCKQNKTKCVHFVCVALVNLCKENSN